MKFWRVHLTHEAGESAGYQYATSAKDAEAFAARWRAQSPGSDLEPDHDATVEAIDITPTRAGILQALQRWAAHCDNG